ncbi:hypothetical protein FKM82_010090 [Ascaphus truei]
MNFEKRSDDYSIIEPVTSSTLTHSWTLMFVKLEVKLECVRTKHSYARNGDNPSGADLQLQSRSSPKHNCGHW